MFKQTHLIDDGLAVGSVDCADEVVQLTGGFLAVVSLITTKDREGIAWVDRPCGLDFPVGIAHHHVEIADGEGPELGFGRGLDSYLDDIVAFSDLHRGKMILVCCGRGLSRSAAAAAAILCWRRGWSVGGAIARVKSRRPGADPCPPFVAALERWSLRWRGLTRTEARELLKLVVAACEGAGLYAIESAWEAYEAVGDGAAPIELRRLAEFMPPTSRRQLFDMACLSPKEAQAATLIKHVLRSVRS